MVERETEVKLDSILITSIECGESELPLDASEMPASEQPVFPSLTPSAVTITRLSASVATSSCKTSAALITS